MPKASDPAPAAPEAGPTTVNLITKRAHKFGEVEFAEGSVMAQITLPPGAPFDFRFITRQVEEGLIIAQPPAAPAAK